jgi:hypothetical protein
LFFAEEDTSAMVILALCNQSVAMLYLHLARSLSISNQKTDVHFLSSTHRVLTINLSKLLARSSLDTEGPIHTQLYKFVTWPLVIATYARAGRGAGVVKDEIEDDAKRDLESAILIVAAGVLEKARDRRVLRTGGHWSWDDAFTSRCSFCVL